MFCQKCGAQLADDGRFCQKCGQQVIQDDTTSGELPDQRQGVNRYEDLSAELKAELHKHKSQINLKCQNCGYTGLMGVTGENVRWWASWWLWIPIAILSLPTGYGLFGALIAGAFIGAFRWAGVKKRAICPACKALLNEL
jgi:hypothetical protein